MAGDFTKRIWQPQHCVDAVLQLMAGGRKIEVQDQETVNKIFNFHQAMFAPPSK